jgi:hypothetical protein
VGRAQRENRRRVRQQQARLCKGKQTHTRCARHLHGRRCLRRLRQLRRRLLRLLHERAQLLARLPPAKQRQRQFRSMHTQHVGMRHTLLGRRRRRLPPPARLLRSPPAGSPGWRARSPQSRQTLAPSVASRHAQAPRQPHAAWLCKAAPCARLLRDLQLLQHDGNRLRRRSGERVRRLLRQLRHLRLLLRQLEAERLLAARVARLCTRGSATVRTARTFRSEASCRALRPTALQRGTTWRCVCVCARTSCACAPGSTGQPAAASYRASGRSEPPAPSA